MEKEMGKTLPAAELAAFCAQLSMILRSGITLGDGLSVMSEDNENVQGKAVLEGLAEMVEQGEPLAEALKAAGKFPIYMIEMIHIGEQSGQLDVVMESLCEYYEREEKIVKSVRSAVTYPLVMISMMFVVLGVLVVKVLPVFRLVFLQLGGNAGIVSTNAMKFGSVLGGAAMVFAGVVLLFALVLIAMRSTKSGQEIINKIIAHSFATKKLSEKISSGRVASALSLTLSSGLDTDESLEMAQKLVESEQVRHKLENCRNRIAQGETFADALVSEGVFTGLYGRMIAVGFRTGTSDTAMKKLAERYEEEIDSQIAGMISIIEPTMVAVLAVVVGMILLSVMLPLMGIMTSIGG
ncbi:MAG: type II secretion system F family protein [Oscillospiraceae bacterium]|nr:type II secretion system F family protein [Oscillospiraceae bacterium]